MAEDREGLSINRKLATMIDDLEFYEAVFFVAVVWMALIFLLIFQMSVGDDPPPDLPRSEL